MCSLEFSDLETKIWRRFRERGVTVLGLSGDGLFGDESIDTLTRFVAQTGVSFPVLLGDGTRTRYGRGAAAISPYPFDVVIDKRGIVRYQSARFDSAAMVSRVEQLLAEPQ